MKRYRCNHCGTIFVSGDVRDCCLPAAVSEQRRLRRKLKEAEILGRTRAFADEAMKAVRP